MSINKRSGHDLITRQDGSPSPLTIDTSKRGTIFLSVARSGPDERSGGTSGYRASSPKQTTAKIRCIADSGSAKVIVVTRCALSPTEDCLWSLDVSTLTHRPAWPLGPPHPVDAGCGSTHQPCLSLTLTLFLGLPLSFERSDCAFDDELTDEFSDELYSDELSEELVQRSATPLRLPHGESSRQCCLSGHRRESLKVGGEFVRFVSG